MAVRLFSGLLQKCVDPRWQHTGVGEIWQDRDICEAPSSHGNALVLEPTFIKCFPWLFIISFFVFSVSNLLRAGAISEPLWFPVVQAFPPLTETKINRKGDEELMHKITYPEDEFRK